MRPRGLLAALGVAAAIAASASAPATTAIKTFNVNGVYLLNGRHTPGYIKVDCPSPTNPVHHKQIVPVRPFRIAVRNNMLQGHPLHVGAVLASVSWSLKVPMGGGSALQVTSYHFTNIGSVPDVTKQVTWAGHWVVGDLSCTVSGSTGQSGKRIAR